MSVIPKKGERLDLYEGSTFDETWTFTDEDDALIDLTGWSASLQVKPDYDSAAILTCASGALVVGPSANAIVLGGTAGTLRIYVGSTLMAALNASQFTATPQDNGPDTYEGVWDLELANPAGERFRYVMGKAVFSREVTT